jgi:hypothetical protein
LDREICLAQSEEVGDSAGQRRERKASISGRPGARPRWNLRSALFDGIFKIVYSGERILNRVVVVLNFPGSLLFFFKAEFCFLKLQLMFEKAD